MSLGCRVDFGVLGVWGLGNCRGSDRRDEPRSGCRWGQTCQHSKAQIANPLR